MKAVKICLWLQILAAVVGFVLAGDARARGTAGQHYYSRCMKDLEEARRAPGYQASPRIHGLSQFRMIELLQIWSADSAHVGTIGLFASVGLVLVSGVEIWLLRGFKCASRAQLNEPHGA